MYSTYKHIRHMYVNDCESGNLVLSSNPPDKFYSWSIIFVACLLVLHTASRSFLHGLSALSRFSRAGKLVKGSSNKEVQNIIDFFKDL